MDLKFDESAECIIVGSSIIFFPLLGGDVNDPSPRSRRLEISFNQYAENKVLNIQITLL